MTQQLVSLIDGSKLGIILVTINNTEISIRDGSHEKMQKLWRFIGIPKRYNFSVESIPNESRPWLDKTLKDYCAANGYIDWQIAEKNKSEELISITLVKNCDDNEQIISNEILSPEFGYENIIPILHEIIINSGIISGNWKFIFQITDEEFIIICGKNHYITSNNLTNFLETKELVQSPETAKFFVGSKELFASLKCEFLQFIDTATILSSKCEKIFHHPNTMISILVSVISNNIFPKHMIIVPKIAYKSGFYPIINSRSFSSSFKINATILFNDILTKWYKWLILFLITSFVSVCSYLVLIYKNFSYVRFDLNNRENIINESKNKIEKLLSHEFAFEDIDQIISFFQSQRDSSINIASLKKVIGITKKFPPQQILYIDKSMTITYKYISEEAKRLFSELSDPVASFNNNKVKLVFK